MDEYELFYALHVFKEILWYEQAGLTSLSPPRYSNQNVLHLSNKTSAVGHKAERGAKGSLTLVVMNGTLNLTLNHSFIRILLSSIIKPRYKKKKNSIQTVG